MGSSKGSILEKRKLEGIRIPLENDVEAREASTYFEHTHLVHSALPELNFDEIDTSTTFLGISISAPLLVDAITGGTELAGKINETLASVVEQEHIGMVLGSQRAGIESQEFARTYAVAREKAPTAFLAANIGGAQLAGGFTVEDAQKLVDMIRGDALVVHLNPLQELIQPEGEAVFKGVLARITELCRDLTVPVIVKEVGAGISQEVALKLELAGVSAINVAGVGGTSWAGVECMRAESQSQELKASLGKLLWDWGIPTALSLIEVKRAVKVPVIASGGIRNGLDIAKSLALGADVAGMALPMLKAAAESKEALTKFIKKTVYELKATMYLVGAKGVKDMNQVRYTLTGPLAARLRA